MDDDRSFERIAALSAIPSVPLVVATTVVGLIPVNFDLDAANDLRLFPGAGPSGADPDRVSKRAEERPAS